MKEDGQRAIMLFGEVGDDSKNSLLIIHGRDAQQDILVRNTHPLPAPEQHRIKLAEFMTRANYGMNLGCFKIDVSDGEMYFEVSVDVEFCNKEDTNMLLETMVNCVRQVWERYQSGIIALCRDTEISAETAIKVIEG